MKRFLFSILFISASIYSSESDEQARPSGSSKNLQALAGVVASCFRQCDDAGGRVAGIAISFDTGSFFCVCRTPDTSSQDTSSNPSHSEDNSGIKRASSSDCCKSELDPKKITVSGVEIKNPSVLYYLLTGEGSMRCPD